LLVAPGDAGALAEALRSWLGDAALRERLRGAARERRQTLPTWSATAAAVAEALR
jgi:glycosyltransferase involved in cell wall biosynthesis